MAFKKNSPISETLNAVLRYCKCLRWPFENKSSFHINILMCSLLAGTLLTWLNTLFKRSRSLLLHSYNCIVRWTSLPFCKNALIWKQSRFWYIFVTQKVHRNWHLVPSTWGQMELCSPFLNTNVWAWLIFLTYRICYQCKGLLFQF